MKFRILENTYEDLSIGYMIEIQKASNEDWKLYSSRKYEKQKDAEDVILAILAVDESNTLVSSIILPMEYE